MKRVGLFVFLLMVLLILPMVSSYILINEVEANPEGTDSGNEWIEFYSNEQVNLSFFAIENNDGDVINLTGYFSGYFVYTFQTQWLDNTDEKVLLKNYDLLVHETPIFEDSFNDDQTYSYCNTTGFEFKSSTKNQLNDCSTPNPPTNTTNSTNEPEPEPEEDEEETSEEEESTVQNIDPPSTIIATQEDLNEPIELNAKDIKTPENKQIDKKDYAPYYLITFCVLLIFLYLLNNKKKKRNKKNEFQ